MKKNILLISCIIVVILIIFSAGYLVGKKSNKTDNRYVYYCKASIFEDGIWVNPKYNDYPMYDAAKAYEEEYGYRVSPNQIICEKIKQP